MFVEIWQSAELGAGQLAGGVFHSVCCLFLQYCQPPVLLSPFLDCVVQE